MKFSYCMLPDYPLSDSIEMIKTADELGYHACYSVDETWHKDLWVLFAAAADKTERIRFGPNVTHVFLREPTLICQQLATLDELTDGRMEAVVSTGNFGMMQQYHIDWEHQKPLSRLKEALHVMRTFLDDGKIDFEGDFFQYTGLFTAARPVQDRIPLLMGGMKGPRSFSDRRRAGRRLSPSPRLFPRGLRLLGREHARGRRARRPHARRFGHWRLDGHGRIGGLRGRQARRAHACRLLHLLDAAGAARRHGIDAGGSPAGRRGAGRRRHGKRAYELFRPELVGEAVAGRHAGGGASRRSSPTSSLPGSTT